MAQFLYKVTAPRAAVLFQPSTFYRTADFKSSSRNPKPGYEKDRLLYVGDREEISIHLFPKIDRIRVRKSQKTRSKLRSLGFAVSPQKRCYIFIHREDEKKVMEFEPTLYIFEAGEFTKTPSNEYISREPVTAIGTESYTMSEILVKWSIQLIHVDSVPTLEKNLKSSEIRFSYQR